jgi:hypothetical protein
MTERYDGGDPKGAKKGAESTGLSRLRGTEISTGAAGEAFATKLVP